MDKYEKTFILDWDQVENGIVACYVPPGYRFIAVYYGGCDPYAEIYPSDNSIDDEIFCEAAIELANDCDLDTWKEKYFNVLINLDTDIILAANTKWGKQYAELYLPDGVNAIWTDRELAVNGEEKIAAAKFLSSQWSCGKETTDAGEE